MYYNQYYACKIINSAFHLFSWFVFCQSGDVSISRGEIDVF